MPTLLLGFLSQLGPGGNAFIYKNDLDVVFADISGEDHALALNTTEFDRFEIGHDDDLFAHEVGWAVVSVLIWYSITSRARAIFPESGFTVYKSA